MQNPQTTGQTQKMSDFSLAGLAKRGYVLMLRCARALARATGFLRWLERRESSRTAHWLRSLFAIHDIDEMIRLDVPWWTYDAIDAVDAFLADRPNAKVFEYGSGASTVWAAKRAGSVTSVEHDSTWADLVETRLSAFPHARLIRVAADPDPQSETLYQSAKHGYRGQSFKAYVHAIDDQPGPYDLIVVDGRARVGCFHHAQAHLAPGGMIVFDNSNRPHYRAAIAAAQASFRRLKGLAPSLPYRDETTLITTAPDPTHGS
jgi:predicted O-methyltransferase YrrM